MPRFQIDHRAYYAKRDGATTIRSKLSGATAILYTSITGHPCAAIFIGKQNKPWKVFRYDSPQQRAERVALHMKYLDASHQGRAEQKAKYAEERARPHKLEVGHVLRCSWGYDQTNVDFYQITDLTAKTVTIRKISSIATAGDGWTGKVIPHIDDFRGEPMTRRASASGSVKINSYQIANLWEGRPEDYTAYA